MQSLHPDRSVLAGYFRDELPPPRRRKVGKHVSGCPVCQRRMDQLGRETEEAAPIEYGNAFKRAFELVRAQLTGVDEETQQSAILLSEILEQPSDKRLELVLQDPRFHALKLCQRLQDRSRADWFMKPTRALESARLAVAIADFLDEGRYGSGLVAETRARAWGLLGNAYRLCCNLQKAEQALSRAVEYQNIAADPSVESEVLGFKASLCHRQGRSEECLALLRRVLKISREAGDLLHEGRALTLQGKVLGDLGRYQEASRILRKALTRTDLTIDPELALGTRYNFMNYLAELGRPHEAQQLLERDRRLFLESSGQSLLARLNWLEAMIHEDFGRLQEATVHLLKARELFLEREHLLQWALVSHHLAVVLSRQGNLLEGRRVVEEAIPVLDFLDLPEAMAARVVYFRLRATDR